MLILYSHPHTLTICTQYSFHVPILKINKLVVLHPFILQTLICPKIAPFTYYGVEDVLGQTKDGRDG